MSVASWAFGAGRSLTLDRPRLMAIINCTPDSFSDGGEWNSPERGAERAARALAEGADVLDLGGESTRPGAERVDASEQVRRVVPVIERIRASGMDAPISVDTTLAAVARAALDAGADIINDVAAGTEDDAMIPLASERRCGLVLMHRLRPPGADRYSHDHPREPEYDERAGGVVGVVRSFLHTRACQAMNSGVAKEAIVLDPGLGFGKSVGQNFELIRRTGELAELGFPVLSGASRKSFVGHVAGIAEPSRRGAASAAVSVAHWLAGARIFRVHDVAAHVEALRIAAAVQPG